MGPQPCLIGPQKIFADWEYVLGARQRLSPIWDSPSVRFDKAVRSIKICLALSRLQRRKLTMTLMVIRNMNTTWISCKYTIIISGLWGQESSRWYLTSEDWPLALAGWLIGSLQGRMFQECRNLDYRWWSWESVWKLLSRKRTEPEPRYARERWRGAQIWTRKGSPKEFPHLAFIQLTGSYGFHLAPFP